MRETPRPWPGLTTPGRVVGLLFTSVLFIGAGTTHFVEPEPFVAMVPPSLPAPYALVYVSGALEILGGIAIWAPGLRRLAGWGLLALLAAVFPANVHAATEEIYMPGMPADPRLLWARLPVQLVFALLVSWSTGIWPKIRRA